MAQTKEVIKVSDNKFDFGQFYFSYAKYHYNDTNKWLHIIFIPTIVFTLLGMLHYARVFTHLTIVPLQVDFGFLLLSVLLPLYLFVDLVTGLVSSVFFLFQLFLSNYLYANRFALFGSEDTHFRILVYLHIAAWIA